MRSFSLLAFWGGGRTQKRKKKTIKTKEENSKNEKEKEKLKNERRRESERKRELPEERDLRKEIRELKFVESGRESLFRCVWTFLKIGGRRVKVGSWRFEVLFCFVF